MDRRAEFLLQVADALGESAGLERKELGCWDIHWTERTYKSVGRTGRSVSGVGGVVVVGGFANGDGGWERPF